MERPKIIDIDQKNMGRYPPACFQKSDNPGIKSKLDWLKKRFKEGMKIKQLYLDEKMVKANGFIEYTPGEYAWRAVDAKDYLFVHCIWIYPNKNKKKGYGSMLLNSVVDEAKKKKLNGVAAIVSEGSFMADKSLFIKNGFRQIDSDGKESLLALKFKKSSPSPSFRDYKKQLSKYKGFHILYTRQCPWVNKFIDGLDAKKYGIKVTEIKTARQAQDSPSIYASFNLIKDGKILADRYISDRRFENILKKKNKTINH
jgi:N-acetylglutamate synthase-like GNAT family acetyltransferase